MKSEIHWAVKYRLSDGQNYPRGIIQWKNYIPGIIEEELSENYGGSSCWAFHHLLPQNGNSLEKKENTVERNFVEG